MGFTQSVFIFVLFPICLIGYFLFYELENKVNIISRLRLRDVFLCLFSLFFYSFFNVYNLISIVALIVFTYISGVLINRYEKYKRMVLVISLISMVSLLFFFKYFSFVVNSASQIFGNSFRIDSIIAPLGISFIVFSSISYIMDIYRSDAEIGSFLDAALYLTFFPKVISGPIVLWKDFKKQISNVCPNTDLFITGINRICIGFAKKTILADTFGSYVNEVIENMNIGIDTASAWILVLFFFFQIYYDFSGYSDISIGISNILGFNFDNNFNFPYMSTSITDFWKRWHISLGRWFKEYLYIPLGGNRKSKARTLINLMIVFIVTGIWHGAGILYIAWGFLHGICRVIERCIADKKIYKKTPSFIKWIFTTFIVMIGWTAFCFDSWSELSDFLKVLFCVSVPKQTGITALYFCNVKAITVTATALLGATLFSIMPLRNFAKRLRNNAITLAISELGIMALFVLALIFMINSTYSPFLYFQY